MGSNKAMEDLMANMPNPDAIFQSWWPFIIAGLCGVIYGFRQWIRGPKCIGGSNLKNKTVIITGASGCIGKEIAMNLARRGGRIVLAGRNEAEGKETAENIRKETENMNVYFLKLDLNSFKSIREFVERFKKKEKSLHILINNAGVMMCPKEKSKDGFDIQFQTNYLGPFLLTELLLDMLKESAPSRIINTTASAHNLGEINFDDVNHERREYAAGDMFAQSKLAVVLHTFQLAERLKGTNVTCNVINPGICNTEIYRHLPLKSRKFIRISFGPFMWMLMKYAEDGAQIAVYCATADEVADATGKHFKDCKEEPLASKCTDSLLQEQLYRASLKWTEQASGTIEAKEIDQEIKTDTSKTDNGQKAHQKRAVKSDASKPDSGSQGQSAYSTMERVAL